MKVYIDGQNFLYKAAEILMREGYIDSKDDLYQINIRSLMANMFDEPISEILFFGAKVHASRHYDPQSLAKAKKFADVSRRLRNCLKNQGVTFVEAGQLKLRDSDYCRQCGNNGLKFQEKGVDVGLAVALVADRLRDKEQVQAIVSSDTDLMPAIKEVRKNGGQVIYVGFSTKLTNSLSHTCNRTEVIRDAEIIRAFCGEEKNNLN